VVVELVTPSLTIKADQIQGKCSKVPKSSITEVFSNLSIIMAISNIVLKKPIAFKTLQTSTLKV
jgi:hypothetical protein